MKRGFIMRIRQEYVGLAQQWLASAVPHLRRGNTRLDAGETSAHYPADVAGMEGFSRLLWLLAPLLSGGEADDFRETFIDGIRHGCDPEHPDYWGSLADNDQRCVEMAAFGLALALPGTGLWSALSIDEQNNLERWLRQSADIQIPDNNWHFFPVLVQVGLKCVGRHYDMMVIDKHLNAIEPFWLGNGWYADGAGKPRDYYISSGFHFYSLLYSHFMQDADPERCLRYRQRARQFAKDYIHYFTGDGNAIPFGRSLTYRFVQVAFWSAVAYTGLDVFSVPVIKGLILRHIDWWMSQPFIGPDGLFTLGYTYPNLVMTEDYNSPGSPYWACKALLILALPQESAFWQAEPAPLPALETVHPIAEAGQFIVHAEDNHHVWMLMSGQYDRNNFVNFDAKYCKFAYSSHFGFTLERGVYGLNHAACDSMLMFSEQDGYWRGRRECDAVEMTPAWLRSVWRPWPDVSVTTWLIPHEQGHLRLHRVVTPRTLDCVEGGFALNRHHLTTTRMAKNGLTLSTTSGVCQIEDLLAERQPLVVTTPPNSNILYASPGEIPCLGTTLTPGTHWLACSVNATMSPTLPPPVIMAFDRVNQVLTLNSKTLEIK
ncbi:hypothetical protein CKO_02449 [Citrobacter koseri ATCC BAA-895]|uniref:DUF2264 domain-containing protein n=2 Tax=Enterobacteriaceae TaxID=543 RepID=A8AJA3_CITK8|nr:hypothetical protein CKO_02449 [Citrobacter koseri ATCC BAA-895]